MKIAVVWLHSGLWLHAQWRAPSLANKLVVAVYATTRAIKSIIARVTPWPAISGTIRSGPDLIGDDERKGCAV